MYSNNPKHAKRSREFIARHVPKIRKVLGDGKPKRFTQIMIEAELGRSQASQTLRAMEFTGEIRTFQAKDPNASHTDLVTWFQIQKKTDDFINDC